jgi:ribulose-phosphate 3-epimerase
MASKLLLAPSILSADFGRLAQEVRDVEVAGADWIHVDVMDGSFVPNITVGPDIVKAVKAATRLPLDVHLMVSDPGRYIEAFAKAGADILSVHPEATIHLQRVLRQIREHGKRASVALNPHTHESVLEYVVDDLDMVLVMSVNPGFAGQAFLPAQVEKVRRVRALLDRHGSTADVEVDGGVSPKNAQQLVQAGANALVAGAAIFGQADRLAAVNAFRASMER